MYHHFPKSPFVSNFTRGVGSVVVLCPQCHQAIPPCQFSYPSMYWSETDALRSDWVRVGDDFHRTLTRVSDEVPIDEFSK